MPLGHLAPVTAAFFASAFQVNFAEQPARLVPDDRAAVLLRAFVEPHSLRIGTLSPDAFRAYRATTPCAPRRG